MAIVGIEAVDILDRWITTVCSEGLKLGFLLDIFFNDCKIVESLVKQTTYTCVQERGHLDFICRLKDYLQRSEFIDRTIDALDSHFSVKSVGLDPLNVDFKPSSRLLQVQELEKISLPV